VRGFERGTRNGKSSDKCRLNNPNAIEKVKGKGSIDHTTAFLSLPAAEKE